MDKNFSLLLTNTQSKNEIAKIKDCNKYSIQYGLTLTDEQIKSVIQVKNIALNRVGRIEFGESVIDKIIEEFCDSPYISNDNYEETLCDLIEMFYYYKNEMLDYVTDEELIKFMKKAFDNECQGSTEYLSDTVLYRMRENVLNGRAMDYSDAEGE